MDQNRAVFSTTYTNFSNIDENTILTNSDQYPYFENGHNFDIPSPDLSFFHVPPDPDPIDDLSLSFTLSPGGESFLPSESLSPNDSSSDPLRRSSSEGEEAASSSSPSEDSDSADPLLKFISQMLMEEDMENEPHMFYDPLSLKATEKSLYDALGEENHPSFSSPQPYLYQESPNSNLSRSGSDYGGGISTSTATSDFVDPQFFGDLDTDFLKTSLPGEYHSKTNLQRSVQLLSNPSNDARPTSDAFLPPSASEMVQNMFSDEESILQFKRGMEEASKFLPSTAQLVIDLESNTFSSWKAEESPVAVVKEEKTEGESLLNGSRGRKNHEREDLDLEAGRSNKQSAVFVEESELSEMFDKVLLWPGTKEHSCCTDDAERDAAKRASQLNEKSNGSSGGKTRAKKQVRKKETVDLRALLILCAQATSANDFRTANELLKQIRQHSSPHGDGSQRLAHYFANGLEARLAGTITGTPTFLTFLASRRTTAADMLKAYKTHIHCAPFKKLTIFFAIKAILDAGENATTIHIVDFGVLYGFQWPVLIQKLSERNGGPPKLRITGIEFPQQGFRPAERIEETGRRLARYCERFKVPFEYNPIAAQNWESIPIEDLKINSNEMLAVNSLFRFKNLLDETGDVSCPRNAVLNLIWKMNPDIFVTTETNGSYNAPFFLTRFREALFHFSSLFDMFDCTLPREDQERLTIESEFYGREAMNVVSSEGLWRVERPETYKQWQARIMRAGFKQLPLDGELMKKFEDKIRTYYHKDFVIDKDGQWMLLGWKGRIFCASACWAPV